MTQQDLIQTIKDRIKEFTNDQILDAATIVDEAFKRNFQQFYEKEDHAEEFIDTFVESINNLPPELAQVLKDKINQL